MAQQKIGLAARSYSTARFEATVETATGLEILRSIELFTRGRECVAPITSESPHPKSSTSHPKTVIGVQCILYADVYCTLNKNNSAMA